MFLVALIGIACQSPRPAGNAAPSPPPVDWLGAATEGWIDARIEQAMADAPVPAFELCVVKSGQVVYNKAFGLADVASGKQASTHSVMPQASVTKPLVAMAVMQLAEQGAIDLDAPVTTYLPYFTMADSRYEDVTVRMLLAHRSGLPDMPFVWYEALDPAMAPLEQAVRDLGEMYLVAAPGEAWYYSNYGYAVLGQVIAEVSGMPFEVYMREKWLAPLGMAHSTFVTDDVDPELRMTLYGTDEDGNASPEESTCDGRDAASCNLWSSCEDMVKLARFVLNRGELDGRRFLQPESFDAMWSPVSETPWPSIFGPWYGNPLEDYGLGWAVGDMQGHRFVGHNGLANGFNALLGLAPDDGVAVVAMTNWQDFAHDGANPATLAALDVLYHVVGADQE